MTWSALYTVVVSVLFIALLYWVLKPANKKKLEGYGRIPFGSDNNDEPSSTSENQQS